MTKRFLLASLVMLMVVLTSCYKQQEEAVLTDYDITMTNYDTDFDFKTYNTFTIRDSVLIISDYLTDAQIAKFYKAGGGNEKILAKISQEFVALGYTKVSAGDGVDPDFVVNPTATFMQQTDYYYSPGWWWGYPGYWGYYGYWKSEKNTDYYYYPWYPSWGYSYSYTYETATLIIEMLNGDSVKEYLDWLEESGPNPDPSDAPKVQLNWNATISGIASTTADYNKSRTENGIEEAFNQSPYLKK